MTTTDRLNLFEGALALTIENLVRQHHTIYPWLPPQGIYFEALAHRAFSLCGIPGVQIAQTSPNQPEHDLIVGGARISLKTETGKGTKPERISITKLCTTERDPWESGVLVARVMAHLARYDRLLMLRALWTSETHIVPDPGPSGVLMQNAEDLGSTAQLEIITRIWRISEIRANSSGAGGRDGLSST